MAICIAKDNVRTKDGRKYYYRFSYNVKVNAKIKTSHYLTGFYYSNLPKSSSRSFFSRSNQ